MDSRSLAKTWLASLRQKNSPAVRLLGFVKTGFCLGLLYGVIVSVYMVATIQLQTEAIIWLTLIALVFAGAKGGAIGMALWLLFTVYNKGIRRDESGGYKS